VGSSGLDRIGGPLRHAPGDGDGYQNRDGLGWRVNWWQWDQYSSGTSQEIFFGDITKTDLRLTFQKLDLLATQMVSFRRWDLVFSGGVTYVGNNNNINLTDLVGPGESFGVNSHFDGWGLTTGLLAIRDIPGMPGLKLVSSVQWSGVYGNTVFAGIGDAAGEQVALEGTMANILELKIGPQYERCIGRGTTFFAGGGFEAQYWSGLSGLNFIDGVGGDIGLVGFTVNTGIRR